MRLVCLPPPPPSLAPPLHISLRSHLRRALRVVVVLAVDGFPLRHGRRGARSDGVEPCRARRALPLSSTSGEGGTAASRARADRPQARARGRAGYLGGCAATRDTRTPRLLRWSRDASD
jgi:hypothetical protein